MCVSVCSCICVHSKICKYNRLSQHSISGMYMISALVTWYWITWGLFPGENYFSYCQNSLLCCSSVSRLETPILSLFPYQHKNMEAILVQLCQAYMLMRLHWCSFSDFSRRQKNLTTIILLLLLLKPFHPLFPYDTQLRLGKGKMQQMYELRVAITGFLSICIFMAYVFCIGFYLLQGD